MLAALGYRDNQLHNSKAILKLLEWSDKITEDFDERKLNVTFDLHCGEAVARLMAINTNVDTIKHMVSVFARDQLVAVQGRERAEEELKVVKRKLERVENKVDIIVQMLQSGLEGQAAAGSTNFEAPAVPVIDGTTPDDPTALAATAAAVAAPDSPGAVPPAPAAAPTVLALMMANAKQAGARKTTGEPTSHDKGISNILISLYKSDLIKNLTRGGQMDGQKLGDMMPASWRFIDTAQPRKYQNAMALVEFLWTDEAERELIRKGMEASSAEERISAQAFMVDMSRRVKAATAYLSGNDYVAAQSNDAFLGTGNKVNAAIKGLKYNGESVPVAVQLYPWKPKWLEWPRTWPEPLAKGPLSVYRTKPEDAQEDECFHVYVSRKTAASNKRKRK
jgi:hypothetical protein